MSQFAYFVHALEAKGSCLVGLCDRILLPCDKDVQVHDVFKERYNYLFTSTAEVDELMYLFIPSF